MPGLIRVHLLEPRVVSPSAPATATPLFPNTQVLDAFWVLVQVRSIGTATYVRLGNLNAQEITFLGAGDFMLIDVPQGFVFNAATLFIKSDTADPVIEVSGAFPAAAPYAIKEEA